jgi:hypothetical protein
MINYLQFRRLLRNLQILMSKNKLIECFDIIDGLYSDLDRLDSYQQENLYHYYYTVHAVYERNLLAYADHCYHHKQYEKAINIYNAMNPVYAAKLVYFQRCYNMAMCLIQVSS